MPLANISFVKTRSATDELADLDVAGEQLDSDTASTEPPKSFLQASAEFARQLPRASRRSARKSPTTLSPQERQRIDVKNAWIAAHRDVLRWIYDKLPVSSFAGSLVRQYEQGPLSEGQVVAVRKILAEEAAGAAERMAQIVRAEPVGSDIDLSLIPEGFYAVPDGATRLKIKIDRPTPPSKWTGFIFVSDGAEYGQQKKYGRQAPGKLYTGEIKDALRAIIANPKSASAAYGKLVGRCGLCNRKLEDEESVARGIGPTCMEKFNHVDYS